MEGNLGLRIFLDSNIEGHCTYQETWLKEGVGLVTEDRSPVDEQLSEDVNAFKKIAMIEEKESSVKFFEHREVELERLEGQRIGVPQKSYYPSSERINLVDGPDIIAEFPRSIGSFPPTLNETEEQRREAKRDYFDNLQKNFPPYKKYLIACGMDNVKNPEPSLNTLVDAFLLWVADDASCDVFLTMEYRLQNTIETTSEKYKPSLDVLRPLEVLQHLKEL